MGPGQQFQTTSWFQFSRDSFRETDEIGLVVSEERNTFSLSSRHLCAVLLEKNVEIMAVAWIWSRLISFAISSSLFLIFLCNSIVLYCTVYCIDDLIQHWKWRMVEMKSGSHLHSFLTYLAVFLQRTPQPWQPWRASDVPFLFDTCVQHTCKFLRHVKTPTGFD